MQILSTTSPEFERYMAEAPAIRKERLEDERRKVIPHIPLYGVLSDGAWRGERCFIIGGGPSLRGFDFERLRGAGRIITINKSALSTPFADVWFFMDYKNFYSKLHRGEFGEGMRKLWHGFEGFKVFLNLKGKKVDDAYSLRSLGRTGLSLSLRQGLYHGNNSGVGAIGLAMCLRANPIYLLGVDCKTSKDGKTHYHDGYGRVYYKAVFETFKQDFENLARRLNGRGFQVVNLNPDSGVRCFPFSTVDEVLGNGKISESAGMDQAETKGI